MDAGKMRHRITLTTPGAETTDADGFPTMATASTARVWAARENLHGSEFFSAARPTGKVVVKFKIRYRSGITRHMTITDAAGIVYNILYVDDIRGEHIWIEVMCEAVG